MDQMTSKERIQSALEGKPVDRIPFSPFLAYVWEHFPQEIQRKGQLSFLKEVGADPLWRGAVCPVKSTVSGVTTERSEDEREITVKTTTPVGSVTSVWLKSDTGNTAFLVGHPLRTEEDYKVQLWIEEHTHLEYNLQAVADHLSGPGQEGLSIGMLFPRGKTAFQSLIEHHVGTEELIYALCDFPATVESLLAAMVENDLEAARMAVESDYEYFLTWEDSSTQNYSPAMYEKYIGSEIRSACEILVRAGKKYIQHACGHVKHLLELMKAGGVVGIESISPPPTGNVTLKEAREMVGSSFAIIGGIEPTQLLNLSLEELEPYVEQVIEDGQGGPFVLANSDSCPPGVSVEKFKLISEIAHRAKQD